MIISHDITFLLTRQTDPCGDSPDRQKIIRYERGEDGITVGGALFDTEGGKSRLKRKVKIRFLAL